jgi:metal-responsive CopG/Arc/MetJ family transcriptional regulator
MKVMISLPDELLADVDAEAARRDQSRSALIRAALREHLARRELDNREEALQALRRTWSTRLPDAPEELIRAERDR